MRHYLVILLAAMLVLFCSTPCDAQTGVLADSSIEKATDVSAKALRGIDKYYEKTTNAIDKQTAKMLARMQRKELKLQKSLEHIDSAKAKQLFDHTQANYQQLQQKLQSKAQSATHPLEEYMPKLDSMETALNFLSKPGTAFGGISPDKLQKIQAVSGNMKVLQDKLQVANEAQQFIKEREAYLKQQLQNTSLYKSLMGVNKEVYYYQQRLIQYKALLNDPEKLSEQILSTVSTLPAFQKFFLKNSYLSQLFRMPGADVPGTAIAGLQTRAGVQSVLNQRLNAGAAGAGGNPQQYFQQQLQSAQSQLQSIKDKLNKLGGGNSDMEMPNFRPNTQRTKSFFQRLEYSFNIQSQAGTGILPARSDLAVLVGYKFSDNKTAGIGASYNLGLGHGFNHIKFTNEGVGIRGFVDVKVKGSIWVSGGYEYTYYQRFAKLSDIANFDTWQKSALLGISKKYSIGKNRQGNIQLLYDFLAEKQIPRGQSLKFRLGYTF